MRYYKICRTILGNETFSKLIEELSNGIIKNYGLEITIEQFIKILDININALIMLSFAQAFPSKKNTIINELQISTSYLISTSIKTFEEEMANYINKFATKLSKN